MDEKTVILGLMGMGGVFTGLSVLALGLFFLPQLLHKIGVDKDLQKSPPAGGDAPPPSPEPAAASAPEEAAPPAAGEPPGEGGPGASPVQPWRLGEGPFGRPDASRWIGPAFRAAFQAGGAAPSSAVEVKVAGKPFQVTFLSLEGSVARVEVNGRELVLDLGDLPQDLAPAAPAVVPRERAPRPKPAAPKRKKATVAAPKPPPASTPAATPAPAAEPGGMVAVRAPIPGTVNRIDIGAGDAIEKGQLIFLLEAMKMDNEICAPAAGVVKEVKVQMKDAVRQGDIMALIEPQEG
ncbi:MAG: acyl-CoA carboxylase biotin carboxyl carrier protein subunit [Planctomycetota bacterium]|jgi:glutaconyl-CoA decarboxylase